MLFVVGSLHAHLEMTSGNRSAHAFVRPLRRSSRRSMRRFRLLSVLGGRLLAALSSCLFLSPFLALVCLTLRSCCDGDGRCDLAAARPLEHHLSRLDLCRPDCVQALPQSELFVSRPVRGTRGP